jgi:hypothetical protein
MDSTRVPIRCFLGLRLAGFNEERDAYSILRESIRSVAPVAILAARYLGSLPPDIALLLFGEFAARKIVREEERAGN